MPREKLNVLVHAEPKKGKSTFAVRRNPGVLILDTEGSDKFIVGVKREVITSMSQMDGVLLRIKSGEVTTVVIDTLDELVNNFAKEEVRRRGGDFVSKLGTLTMAGWGLLRDRFLGLTRSYRDAGADVLTLCHSELIEKPDGGKKYAMKLPSDYAREVMGQMDIVGFMEVYRNAEGKNIHRINFQPTSFYDAGCRAIYNAVEDKFYNALPPTIDDPAFVDIIKAYDKFFAGEGKGFLATGPTESLKK